MSPRSETTRGVSPPSFKQCCGSEMFIPDPDFYPSRIPDLGSKNSNKDRGEKKFHKIENYFIFEMLKKKSWANFQRIIELFPQKFVTKLSKIWVWDPGSEIRDPEKTYYGSQIHGSKKAPDPGSRSATLPSSVAISQQDLWTLPHTKVGKEWGLFAYIFSYKRSLFEGYHILKGTVRPDWI